MPFKSPEKSGLSCIVEIYKTLYGKVSRITLL